jgi:hypothetical protein
VHGQAVQVRPRADILQNEITERNSIGAWLKPRIGKIDVEFERQPTPPNAPEAEEVGSARLLVSGPIKPLVIIVNDCESPLFAALGLQGVDHRGGCNDPGGFVMFEGEEFLVAGHEELGLADFGQREQITVLGVRREGAGG